ncbi:MAG: TRC40/GET3/ArsA family transport-energizing ATPase [Aquificae bacterium]|nr:TRC40/GET3/ArsA family transport-energizing ATPase [Aquificota bacterium]
MRIILFSGKGGVGKTTISAATAYRLAQLGKKTIVVSLDPAHSLADAFDIPEEERRKAKGLPIKVDENLEIQELDIQEEIDRYWGEVYRFIELLFNTTGLHEILSEELAILPGMEEITSLLYVNKYYNEGKHDVLILDLPPTGESIRFVSMPIVMKWYMKKIFKTERLIMKVARPTVGRMTDVPLPDDEYFKALETFYERLKGVDEILLNPDITSIRIVSNPEKMVLKESQRAFLYFLLFGVNVDAVIVNKIIPEEVLKKERCSFLEKWLKTQKKYVEETEDYFSPVPVFKVPLMEEEVVGKERLQKLAKIIYGERSPDEVFHKEIPYKIEQRDGGFVIRIKAPGVSKESVSLVKGEDELVVRVGNFKSHIMLPRKLRNLEPVKAKVEKGEILIFME